MMPIQTRPVQMHKLILACIIVLSQVLLANPALNQDDFTMNFRDYLLQRYIGQTVHYHQVDPKNQRLLPKKSQVRNVLTASIKEGTLFLFEFKNGDKAVLPLKSTGLTKNRSSLDDRKITPERLMGARSFSQSTAIMFGKSGENSSMLRDLEQNMDSYNRKNTFTTKEKIIYTDPQGNIESAHMTLDMNGIRLPNNTSILIGDIVQYDLDDLQAKILTDQNERNISEEEK